MTAADSMFRFGENWLAFAAGITEPQVAEAERELSKLLAGESLAGKTFLDIGSGSGLSSLAARRLGTTVHSFDYDPQSVACTRALRARFRPDDPGWTVDEGSVLDRAWLSRLGVFDVVHSWGVLHHTGDMHAAIENAAALVRPGGLFAFALYRRTRLCRAWTLEKRWYSRARPATQKAAMAVYVWLYRLRLRMHGIRFGDYVKDYHRSRGMDFHRDVHDWLGGYPYESITPAEVAAKMVRLGFTLVHSKTEPMSLGLFGSGCDEFLYRRKDRE